MATAAAEFAAIQKNFNWALPVLDHYGGGAHQRWFSHASDISLDTIIEYT